MDALLRLLRVGSEWGSYASGVGGRGGARVGGRVRAAARELADEAAEQLARRGLRKVDQLHLATQSAAQHKSIVIGENMIRVRAAAKALGASYYRARRIEPFDFDLAMRRNEAWIRRKIRQGFVVYDIGIDLARPAAKRSPFYAMERRVLREMGVEPIPVYWKSSDDVRVFLQH